MHKRFILLLGMLLGSQGPAAAQTLAPQIVLAQGNVAPILTMFRTVSTPLPAASFLLSQDPGKSRAHFSVVFAGAAEGDRNLKPLAPMEVRTLFITQSSLPLVQVWGGRLQLEAFQSTLHMQNVQLGPLGYGGLQGFRPPRQSYLGGPRSVELTGLSLTFHFGRDAWTGRPAHVWQRLTRIIGTVLN